MPRPAKLWWHAQKKRWACKHHGRIHFFTADKQESQREFHRLKLANQPRTDPESVTVAEVLSRYLDHLEANRSTRTYQWTLDNYNQFRKSFDECRLASELTPADMLAWADRYQWSNWTRRQKLTSVQAAFVWATKTRIIDSNPVAWIEKPPKTKRETLVDNDQLKKLLDSDTDFRDLVQFVSLTGCRPQEASMIEARHIKGNVIHLGIVKKRKRAIYPPDELLPMLTMRCQRYPSGPIFRNTRGKPWSRNAIGLRFRRLREKLGGEPITIYTLRHTFITQALLNGTPVQTVAQLAGHSPETTLRIYSHLDHEKFSEDMRKASNEVTNAAKQKAGHADEKAPETPRKTGRKRQRPPGGSGRRRQSS